jgi:hypothetical protein
MTDAGRMRRQRPRELTARRSRRRRSTCVSLKAALAPYGEQILSCFSTAHPVLSIQEIAAKTTLPPPTVEGLVYILTTLGCLASTDDGQYRLIQRLPDGWILTTSGASS